jgi:hypothetical protein
VPALSARSVHDEVPVPLANTWIVAAVAPTVGVNVAV